MREAIPVAAAIKRSTLSVSVNYSVSEGVSVVKSAPIPEITKFERVM